MSAEPSRRTGRRSDAEIRRSALTALLVAALLLGFAAVGVGLLMAGVDLSRAGEDWDGFGVFIGVALGVPGLAVCLLAWFALRLRDRRPARARLLAIVLSVVLVVPVFLAPGSLVVLVPLMIGCGIFGAAMLGARD
jgi:peptidoglycan/LPS O-acetylase OafA/YrhL